ncbi:P-loop containing nucleoside triphosphate hydrolase protein [Cercophora newfieldiana]|uniref:P-loop containing nucleoside triphosphate hydrolase protein n=1 Tax=Cercophora newfieldiana TaxID=92897 RepID=A0AA39YFA4_9PEZI|nr:P-loop containing nucleoside triphosphate hydrolase protein [Cercophora newfieldiana]
MEDQVSRLVDKAWNRFLETAPNKRLLIAISGIPGSGKTTLSEILTNALNTRHATLHPSSPPLAAFVPMDGYHLTRAQLDALPDPVTAHARRGAEFTFDGDGFLRLVEALRAPLTAESGTVYAPSFDHAVKDPKEGDIAVGVEQRVVVFEGNYVLLDKEPWSRAAALMDLRWFVEVDPAVARVRLARRHVTAGIVDSLEEGNRRAVENDLPNGEEVVRRRVEGIDEVVKSVEDGDWVHL